MKIFAKTLTLLMICGALGFGMVPEKAEASESVIAPEIQELGGPWYGPPQPPPPPLPPNGPHLRNHKPSRDPYGPPYPPRFGIRYDNHPREFPPRQPMPPPPRHRR